MTKRERQEVAAVLREWAAWCEQSENNCWFGWKVSNGPAWKAAWPFCEHLEVIDGWHSGPTAATGLLLAAAMVEAGDSV